MKSPMVFTSLIDTLKQAEKWAMMDYKNIHIEQVMGWDDTIRYSLTADCLSLS